MDKNLRFIAKLVLLSCTGIMGYILSREQFTVFISQYLLAFAAFWYLFKNQDDLKSLLRFSYLLRIVLLFATPALSNDFYRFIWDGRMSVLGFNPYLVLPNEFSSSGTMALVGEDAWQLYEGQGTLSPGNYTCYPPVNQFFFILPAWIFPENILFSMVTLRIMLIAADIGTIHYGRKILKMLGMPESNILLYALNPFVVIEITGNLHFEGVTIFFLILAVYHLLKNKWGWSALFLTLSVSVKLIPLIFLPLFLKKLGQRGLIKYSLFVCLGSVLLFLPFLSEGLYTNFMSSIDLYFRRFEFNASIYYLIRSIGYQVYGWNIIQKAGPLLGILVFAIMLQLAIIPKNQKPKVLLNSMLISVSIYYFMTTTVHPWYIAIPLILSVFTTYRFAVLWSLVVMLSYSAYQIEGFQENFWLIATEYGVVYGYFGYEFLKSYRIRKNKLC
jgi:hypothetical protein